MLFFLFQKEINPTIGRIFLKDGRLAATRAPVKDMENSTTQEKRRIEKKNGRFALLFPWGSRDVACLKVHVQPGPSPLYAATACTCVSCDCVGIVSSSSSSVVTSFVVHSGRIPFSREKTRTLNTWLYFETSPGSKEGCIFDPCWRCLCHCSAERNVKLRPFSALWKWCSKPLCIM